MKKTFYILITFFVFYSSFSQSFEGKITYQNSYISKLPNVTSDQFNSMLGTTQEYFIKNGNYKSNTNGTFAQWQMYINADNKLYSKLSNSSGVIWNDATIQGDEVTTFILNKKVVEILGNICDEIILTCKSGVQKYYFCSSFSVDSTQYKNHKFGNWYDYISKSNAVPLKIVLENSQFEMTSVATNISRTELTDSFFKLPEGISINKSPY